MRPSKGNCQKNHFKKRLQERYGLTITNEGYRGIIQAIQTSSKVPVAYNGHVISTIASYRAKQSNRLSVYALLLQGIDGIIPVVYDRERKSLVTTHPDLLDSHKNERDGF